MDRYRTWSQRTALPKFGKGRFDLGLGREKPITFEEVNPLAGEVVLSRQRNSSINIIRDPLEAF